jgi:hypothetical protein
MLNMNKYGAVRSDLFRYGAALDLGMIGLNRYTGGEIRGKVSFLSLSSSGTGHWPFTVFDFNFLTGAQSAWQLTVLGLTVGSKMVHDLDEDGKLQGPDKKRRYFFISFFNHQHQTLEEII